MNICVDENIPLMTVNELRKMGHNVLDIRGSKNEGIEDDILWNLAQKERRLLITTDKGFAKYRDKPHYGILIVRLHQPNRHKIHQSIMYAINRFTSEEWRELLVVMRDRIMSTWKAK